MELGTGFVVLGLILDIIAVIVLIKFSGNVFSWMLNRWMMASGDEIEEEKKKVKKNFDKNTLIAVILLVVGFGLQIVGNLLLDRDIKSLLLL